MENAVIILDFLRNDGKRERTKVAGHTLFEAHEIAEQVLRRGSGLYSEVDISVEDRPVETIQHLNLVAANLNHDG